MECYAESSSVVEVCCVLGGASLAGCGGEQKEVSPLPEWRALAPAASAGLEVRARREGDSVAVRVHARDEVVFASGRLGTSLIGFRDGVWRAAGGYAPSTPADVRLAAGQTAVTEVPVAADAERYRVVFFLSDATAIWSPVQG